MKTAKEINEDIEYVFGKINWGTSFLDAKAIKIMNELRQHILILGGKK